MLSRSTILGLLVACAPMAHGLSIFPEISDTRVAGTTNREIARGIASDGTNFLVMFQGDNLYPAANPTNQLAAQLVSSNGALLGARIDLGLNGGVPLVEFGTSNYLVTWMENASGANPNIRGQFLDRTGNLSGASFLVASNTSAVEVGAMTFAAGTFWIAWAQTNVTNGACVMLQRVSESGARLGDVIAVGSQSSTNQQFPALSRGNTNVLVTWVALRPDTNAWDVLGRFVDANGNASSETVVSQAPAQQAYPVAAAFDGTNHLVVWSREAGPYRFMNIGERRDDQTGIPVPVYTTNQFPALFGRLINEFGGNAAEIPISSARFGQIAPSVAFDGTNHLVAWNDRRHADYRPDDYHLDSSLGRAWEIPAATNQTLYFCFVSRAAVLVDWEFVGTIPPPPGSHYDYSGGQYYYGIPPEDLDNGARINTGPVIKITSGSAAVLRNRRSKEGITNDVSVTSLVARKPGFGEIKLLGIGTNSSSYPFEPHQGPYMLVEIQSTNSNFIPQWSTNGVDWITPVHPDLWRAHWLYGYDFSSTDIIETVSGTGFNNYRLRFDSGLRFYRGLESKYLCKSAMRNVARREEIWALQNNMRGADVPSDSDLFDNFSYFADKPGCPVGGFTYYFFGPVNAFPYCNIPSHGHP